MPTIQLPIEDTESFVTRPVVLSVVQSLLKYLDISPNVRLYYNGVEETALQAGSAMGIDNDPQRANNTWRSDESLTVEVNINHSRERIGSATHRSLATPLFADLNLPFCLSTTYFTQDVQLKLVYNATSRSSAYSWRNALMQKYRDGLDGTEHKASYNYLLPNYFIALSRHIFDLMQTQAPYEGLEYKDWFFKHCASNVTTVANQSQTVKSIGVHETQLGIMTTFEETPIDSKPQKVNDSNAHSMELLFRFCFDKPYTLRLEYPIVVHNSAIHPAFIPQNMTEPAVDHQRTETSGMLGLSYFRYGQNDSIPTATEGIYLPVWDDWRPQYTLSHTCGIFTALCTVNNNDKKTLLDLNDLGDVQLRDDILRWIIEEEYSFMGVENGSVLSISLFENNSLLPANALMVDATGRVSARTDLDLRKVYHVKLSFVISEFALTKEAWVRFKKCRAYAEILQFIKAQNSGHFSQVIGSGSLTGIPQRPKSWRVFHVQTFFKVAYHEKNFDKTTN